MASVWGDGSPPPRLGGPVAQAPGIAPAPGLHLGGLLVSLRGLSLGVAEASGGLSLLSLRAPGGGAEGAVEEHGAVGGGGGGEGGVRREGGAQGTAVSVSRKV